MSEGHKPFAKELGALNRDELRAWCKVNNLSRGGTKPELKGRLLALARDQVVVPALPLSASSSASIRQRCNYEASVLAEEEQDMLGLADTAESPEHNDTEQESPVQHNTFAAASSTPLPKQSPHVPRTSLEEAQQGIKQPFDPVVQSAQSAQAVPKTQPSVYQVNDSLQPSDRQQIYGRNWLLLLAIPVAVLTCLIWPGAKTGRADPNTRCQQTRSIEPLAKFLVGADAKVTLAEMWRGEGLMHNKAGGVLLACSDAASCSAAATAVAQSLPASCGHCLHHFLPDPPASGHSSTARADPEAAGQAQKALVAQLQQCSHAVVIVNSIDTMPPAVLPVLITALSEQGHFEHSGKQIDPTKALFVGILQVPPATLHQEDEEQLAKAVKQHLVQSLKARGAGQSLGSEAGSQTEPLRGRFDYVAEVRLRV